MFCLVLTCTMTKHQLQQKRSIQFIFYLYPFIQNKEQRTLVSSPMFMICNTLKEYLWQSKTMLTTSTVVLV